MGPAKEGNEQRVRRIRNGVLMDFSGARGTVQDLLDTAEEAEASGDVLDDIQDALAALEAAEEKLTKEGWDEAP